MKLNKQFIRKQITFLFTLLFFAAGTLSVSAQKKMDDKKLKDMQAKNEAYMVDLYDVIYGYPQFNYKYVYDDGKLKEVVVVGVDNPEDKNRVAALLYEMRTNKDKMKNYCDAQGVYYAPEREAEPKAGYTEFRKEIQENLEYPEDAKNYGVEGTVYVKFIVDEYGNISKIKAQDAIDSPYEGRVKELEREAVAAVQEVDEEWEPAIVDGDYVESFVVVPVTFDFKKSPVLPTLIR